MRRSTSPTSGGCARSASAPGSRCPRSRRSSTPLLGSLSALLQRHRLWPLWFAAAWTTRRGVAQRLAVRRDALGAARVRRRRHPGGRRAAVRRRGRCQLPARPARRRCSPGWSPARSRGRGAAGSRRAAWSAWSRCSPCPRVLPWEAGPSRRRGHGGRGPGRRAGRRRRHPLRPPPGHPEPRRRHRRPRRQVEDGEAPQPDFVLWPENSTAVDPFDDAETNAGHPGGELRDRRADPGRRDRRRRPRPGAQPGHRLGPGDRRRRPLHQVAPGAVRRVHPVPLASSTTASSTGSARSVATC